MSKLIDNLIEKNTIRTSGDFGMVLEGGVNLDAFAKDIIKEVFKEIREAGIMIPLDYWVGTKKGLILEFQKRLADEIEQKMLKD